MRVSSDPPENDGAEPPERLEPAMLDRYLFEPTTEELTREIERWIAVDPHRRGWVVEARAGSGPIHGMTDGAAQEWFAHMLRRAESGTATQTPFVGVGPAPMHLEKRSGPARRSLNAWYSLRGHRHLWTSRLGLGALAVVIGIGVATVVTHGRSTTPKGIGHTYQTAVAQSTVVTLPDGSRATLAPQSRLVVDAGFGGSSRTVTLTGEAYFDVEPARRAPFVVRTGRISARVLGTAFDVRAYQDDRDVRVAVVSGRVAVQRTGASVTREPVVLGAGMMSRVTDSVMVITDNMDAASYGAWTAGKLVFHDAPVRDVLTALGRWYGYDFRLADTTLAAHQVTVTVDRQSPTQIMTFLKTILDVSLSFDDKDARVVTLHANGSPAKNGRGRDGRDGQWFQPKEVGR